MTGRNFKQKKVWLNKKHSKYCIVKLFADQFEMQTFYKSYCDERKLSDTYHFEVKGCSIHYELRMGRKCSPETGMVLLCFKYCGAGIVSHEFLHAILWAHKHKVNKKQYPFVIKNMKEEEEILHNHTYAVTQFYKWYWKIETQFKLK